MVVALLVGLYFVAIRTNWHGYGDKQFMSANLDRLSPGELIARGMDAIQRGHQRQDSRAIVGYDSEGFYAANKLELYALKCFDLAVLRSAPLGDDNANALADAGWWRFKIRPDAANLDVAAKQLTESEERNPSSARTLTMLAAVLLYRHNGDKESTTEACLCLNRALTGTPNYADAWYLKSQIPSESAEDRIADFHQFLKHVDTLDPFISVFGTEPPQGVVDQIREVVVKMAKTGKDATTRTSSR